MAIAALKDEKKLSVLLCNKIRPLPVTLEAEKDEFIKRIKKQVRLIERQKKGSSESPSSCEQVQLYADSDNAQNNAKENPERISYKSSRHLKNEVIN